MKRLVIVGEGHGDVVALPILARKVLQEKDKGSQLFVDNDVVRAGGVTGLLKWDKVAERGDATKWKKMVNVAAIRRDVAGILAVFDGDASKFPAGSNEPFCPATAAKYLISEAAECGAGKLFSLALVFACVEYESWLIAGAESFKGKHLSDGRIALPSNVKLPGGSMESHGKRWMEENCLGYRPTRDQGLFTEILDLNIVRSQSLRSFARLEHAIEQLVEATGQGRIISTP
jgi:hypothetical protein